MPAHRTTTLFLIVAAGLAVFAVPAAVAHEGPQDAEESTITNTPALPTPPIPGAPEFAAELCKHGGYLFTAEQLTQLEQTNRLFSEAASDLIAAKSNQERLPAERKRARAEQAILDLVRSYANTLPVELRHGQAKMDTTSYRPLASDTAPLLLRIDAGNGPIRFVTVKADIEAFPEPDPPLQIPYSHGGTSWTLLTLEKLPVGRTALNVLFRPLDAQQPPALGILLVETPPQGNLTLTVLDENGKPTPALLRLTNTRDRTLRRPDSAIDFAPQMDNIAGGPGNGPGLPKPLLLPPPVGGLYWCIPGPVNMAMPAGEWEVHLHHGAEYAPIHDVLQIDAGAVTSRSYQLARWTRMADLGWYSGDDHVHSRLVSDDDATRLMAWTVAADLNVVNVLKMGNHMRTYYEQRGFGKPFRVQEGNRVLVPGQEDPRYFMGHAIGLNLQNMVRDEAKYLMNDWIADEIHKQGGLYGHAHLSAMGPPLYAFHIERDMTLLVPLQKSDFGSIMQSFNLSTELYYDFLNLGYKLTASSGTDTPYSSSIGGSRVYAFLGNEPFSADAWFDHMRRGHTFVTNGPMLDFHIDDAIPGDEIRVTEDRPLHIRAKAWGLKGTSAPAKLQIVRLGQVLREAAPGSADADSAELEFTSGAGFGGWYAAYAVGRDGTQAHTTPIYVTREHFRHWDFDHAEELITKRMATLDDIERTLGKAMQELADGKINPSDFYNRRQAEQTPLALERVKQLRTVYGGLRDALLQERALRNGTPAQPK